MGKSTRVINIIKEMSELKYEDITIIEEVMKSCNILQCVKNNKIDNI